MLEEYKILRQEKEEEKLKSREQKRLQEQFVTEEMLFGSKLTSKKPLCPSTNPDALTGTPISRRVGTPARHGVSGGKERRDSGKVVIPANYVALPKEDAVSRGF